MNVEKAIKDITARIKGEFAIKGKDDCKDLKLGREALIGVETIRKGYVYDFTRLLPEETKEEG